MTIDEMQTSFDEVQTSFDEMQTSIDQMQRIPKGKKGRISKGKVHRKVNNEY